MLLNKVVVLLLLVFIVISVDHVSGGCCGNKCTNKQKKGIFGSMWALHREIKHPYASTQHK